MISKGKAMGNLGPYQTIIERAHAAGGPEAFLRQQAMKNMAKGGVFTLVGVTALGAGAGYLWISKK
ncbi:hypothetical protein QVA66_03865 [Staphylococcus chromogenes]|nr:hypothetical protein [Staphylococcus chromogenes]